MDFQNFNETEKSVLDYNILSKNEILNGVFHNLGGFVWNKMFVLDIIKKNNIQFDEKISYCEDLIFLIEYILKIDKDGAILPSLNYFYNYIPATEKYDIDTIKTRLNAIETIIFAIDKCDGFDDLKSNLKSEYIIRRNNLKTQRKFLHIKKHPTYILSLLTSDFGIKFKLYHLLKFIFSM